MTILRSTLLVALSVWMFPAFAVHAQQTPSAQTENQDKAMPNESLPRPKLIIFDVNETLLDLAPLKTSVGKALGGREDLLPLWFSTMLHYTLVETLSGEYHSFGEIGTAALMMVAETQGIELTNDEAKEAIVTPLRSLPPHDDVVSGLKALKQDGYRIVSLTNLSAVGVETQFKNAGLTDLFEKRYSVDTVKKFKPHPDTYRMVLDDLGVKPDEVLMVAAHAWDLAGAKNVGLQTAFVERLGKTLYPNVAKPDYVVNDLSELVRVLQNTERADRVGEASEPNQLRKLDFNTGRNRGTFEKIAGASGADMFKSFENVSPDLGLYIEGFAFGHVFSRPGLSLRDREVAAVAALAALNTSERQLEVHVNAALEAGCEPRELVEISLQTFVFSGFPASVNSMKVIDRVFTERGITVTQGQ